MSDSIYCISVQVLIEKKITLCAGYTVLYTLRMFKKILHLVKFKKPQILTINYPGQGHLKNNNKDKVNMTQESELRTFRFYIG